MNEHSTGARCIARRAAVVAAALMLGILRGPAAAAKDPPGWGEIFASPDPAAAYDVIEDVRVNKRVTSSSALVSAAIGSPHASLATSVGDTLREIGATCTEEDRKSIGAALSGSVAKVRAAARLLAAWAPPDADAALAKASGTAKAAEEALWAAGSLPSGAGFAFPSVEAAIARALDDKRPEIRVAACVAAGRRSLKSVAPRLADIVAKERDVVAGPFAIRALERVGVPEGAKPFFESLRGSVDAEARQQALKAIVLLATLDDAPELVRLTSSREPDDVEAAMLALGRLAQPRLYTVGNAPPALDTLPPGAREDVATAVIATIEKSLSRATRAESARVLARARAWSAPLVRKTLVRWVEGDDPVLRRFAAELAGEFGDVGFRGRLVDVATGDKEPLVRATAARALDLLGAKEGAALLLRAVHVATRPDPRRHAIEALGMQRDPSTIPALVALLDPKAGAADTAAILRSLERLTGHAFGTVVSVWTQWLSTSKAPLRSPLSAFDRAALRKAAVAQPASRATATTEASVERALAWLATAQRTDGTWWSREDGWGGSVKQSQTYTGLALLAFTGAGYGPQAGRYRETVWRAAESLAATARFDGRTSAFLQDRMFGVTEAKVRGIAAFAVPATAGSLVDVAHASTDGAWVAPAQRAVDNLMATREPGSGWGRDGLEPPYLSTTALALPVVLRAAGAGFAIDPFSVDGMDAMVEGASTVPGAIERLSDVVADSSTTVGPDRPPAVFYLEFASDVSIGRHKLSMPKVTLTEAGLASRLLMGWPRSHPAEVGAASYVLEAVPTGMTWPPQNKVSWIHARVLWGAEAMFQMGGRHWRTWADAIERVYPPAQVKEPPELHGSFDSDVTGDDQGRLFTTAICAMILETPYRFPLVEAR